MKKISTSPKLLISVALLLIFCTAQSSCILFQIYEWFYGHHFEDIKYADLRCLQDLCANPDSLAAINRVALYIDESEKVINRITTFESFKNDRFFSWQLNHYKNQVDINHCTSEKHTDNDKKRFREYYNEEYIIKSGRGNGSNLKEIIDAKTLITILHNMENDSEKFKVQFTDEEKRKSLIEEIIILNKRLMDVCNVMWD